MPFILTMIHQSSRDYFHIDDTSQNSCYPTNIGSYRNAAISPSTNGFHSVYVPIIPPAFTSVKPADFCFVCTRHQISSSLPTCALVHHILLQTACISYNRVLPTIHISQTRQPGYIFIKGGKKGWLCAWTHSRNWQDS